MSYTPGVDKSDGDVIGAAEWNAQMGAAGSVAYLKDATDAPMKAQGAGGTVYGGRQKLNFIAGTNAVVTVADDSGNNRVNVTLASSGGAIPTASEGSGAQTIITNTTQGAYGAYTQMIASAAADTLAVFLYVYWATLVTCDFYFEISTGGAGAESVVIPSIPFMASGYGPMPVSVNPFPFKISAGARVAVHVANRTTATQYSLSAALILFE
jgi:hypothetical protein